MKRLGDYGRLGNQIFQYAALRGVSAKRGYQVRLPREHELLLTDVFRIPEPRLTAEEEQTIVNYFQEPGIAFSPELFDIPDHCNIHGYFQSEKYFAHCERELREVLEFRKPVAERADSAASVLLGRRWFGEQPTVSMHIRRGDYVEKPEYHPLCGEEYYEQALGVMRSQLGRVRVVVFSDEIEWCRQTFVGSEFRFSEGNDTATDLALIASCDHHIIANSSYSWWGAWLGTAKRKIVIAPRIWRGPKAKNPESPDQVPGEWLRV